MNELSDLLTRVVDLLRQTQIPHMIAGSFASTYYGAVRMTQDIDIIIAPTLSTLLDFIRHLPEDSYYVDEAAARDAWLRRSMFNVMDMQTGWKVDFIIRKTRPFSIAEFERRRHLGRDKLHDGKVYTRTSPRQPFCLHASDAACFAKHIAHPP